MTQLFYPYAINTRINVDRSTIWIPKDRLVLTTAVLAAPLDKALRLLQTHSLHNLSNSDLSSLSVLLFGEDNHPLEQLIEKIVEQLKDQGSASLTTDIDPKLGVLSGADIGVFSTKPFEGYGLTFPERYIPNELVTALGSNHRVSDYSLICRFKCTNQYGHHVYPVGEILTKLYKVVVPMDTSLPLWITNTMSGLVEGNGIFTYSLNSGDYRLSLSLGDLTGEISIINDHTLSLQTDSTDPQGFMLTIHGNHRYHGLDNVDEITRAVELEMAIKQALLG